MEQVEWLARRDAERAIGKTMTIRTGPNTKVTGRIVTAEFAGLRQRELSRVAQWLVKVEHVSGAVWGPYRVEALPRLKWQR